MNDSRKIELLNELASKLTPQNVDYTPHNGNYCVTLVAVQPVDFFSKQVHIPADPRSPFPVISVHLVCNLQYRWQS